VSDEDPYVLPGSTVLRNKLGATTADALDRVERRLVVQRAREGMPTGDFDLDHLRSIHRHLFQDVYAWAGEVRTVEISKDGSQFQFRRFIGTGMADVHRRLAQSNFLRGLSAVDFAAAAGTALGDVNYVHPFRDGNGTRPVAVPRPPGRPGRTSGRPGAARSAALAGGVTIRAPGDLWANGRRDRPGPERPPLTPTPGVAWRPRPG
jgi:cell filamentation protein